MRRRAAVLLVFGLALTGCSLQAPLTGAQNLATVGKAAPAFSGTDLDGHRLSLADYKGHPVVLNFWASWCGPCRAEQPGLDRVAADFAPRGVRVVGITVRDQLAQSRIFRDEFKMPYPSLFDQAAELGYAYEVDAPPSSVFIDSRGVVVYKLTGALGEADLRQIIQERLLSS